FTSPHTPDIYALSLHDALPISIAAAFIMVQRGGGTSQTNSTFIAANEAAPPNKNVTAPTPSDSLITKPNVKVSSPVVVEEYGDYQCPPCGELYPDLKKIESEYGHQLHFVFHYFPLTGIHKNAMAAACAAEAARLQNKFWEMHDRLYRNQKAWVDEENPRPIFVSYARELGL